LGLVVLTLTSCGAAGAGDDPRSLFRPQARVEADPAAWYSPALYSVMPKPQPGDWMQAHPEPAQSFQEFVASRPVRPTLGRHTIYLSPLGPMVPKDRARMDVLREYMELFYTLPAKFGPEASLAGVTSRDRSMFGRTVRQYLSREILEKTLPPLLPKDGLCLQAVTMEDLYPEPAWNYVFGQAMLDECVGVYSLVRFYPAFWGQAESEAAEQKGLKRSLATLVHETGHMFGVWHCQKYECVMNGSNSLDESDRRPIHLCPECLKKFRWTIGFDMVARYEALKKFYASHAMAAEAAWVEKRLAECRAAGGAAKAK
ncbi:MAG: archaemetzincin, partial [Planctomycetota bacterium]|nr:archaemetzincin [Planctomycetota bacterium]